MGLMLGRLAMNVRVSFLTRLEGLSNCAGGDMIAGTSRAAHDANGTLRMLAKRRETNNMPARSHACARCNLKASNKIEKTHACAHIRVHMHRCRCAASTSRHHGKRKIKRAA